MICKLLQDLGMSVSGVKALLPNIQNKLTSAILFDGQLSFLT